MLHHLIRFFRPSAETEHAYALYAHINQHSRQEKFFTEWGVPDTLDGRFEMILLHMFLYLHTLKHHSSDTTELQRRVIEAFFEDMDRSIREIGVSDTGVSKRIKAMANAFYGRIHAFEKSLHDDNALAEALQKNTFGTTTPPERMEPILTYIRQQLVWLATQPVDTPSFLTEQRQAV